MPVILLICDRERDALAAIPAATPQADTFDPVVARTDAAFATVTEAGYRADAAVAASYPLLTLLDDVLEYSRLESRNVTLAPEPTPGRA